MPGDRPGRTRRAARACPGAGGGEPTPAGACARPGRTGQHPRRRTRKAFVTEAFLLLVPTVNSPPASGFIRPTELRRRIRLMFADTGEWRGMLPRRLRGCAPQQSRGGGVEVEGAVLDVVRGADASVGDVPAPSALEEGSGAPALAVDVPAPVTGLRGVAGIVRRDHHTAAARPAPRGARPGPGPHSNPRSDDPPAAPSHGAGPSAAAGGVPSCPGRCTCREPTSGRRGKTRRPMPSGGA